MFLLSRLAVEALSPLSLSIILFIAGLLFNLFHKRKLGIFFQSLGLLVILTTGYGLFTRQHLFSLENQYPPLNLATLGKERKEAIKYIVVLGSGHVSDSRLPVTSQICGSSLFRLVEGIRLSRELPATQLILSGGIGYDPVPNGEVVAGVARSLGMDTQRILVENRPRDTIQEAKLLQPLLQDKEFILVTSAAHMSRAMSIFGELDLSAIPAPTDYVLKQHHNPPASSFFPSLQNLGIAKGVLYEKLAAIWAFLKKF